MENLPSAIGIYIYSVIYTWYNDEHCEGKLKEYCDKLSATACVFLRICIVNQGDVMTQNNVAEEDIVTEEDILT